MGTVVRVHPGGWAPPWLLTRRNSHSLGCAGLCFAASWGSDPAASTSLPVFAQTRWLSAPLTTWKLGMGSSGVGEATGELRVEGLGGESH